MPSIKWGPNLIVGRSRIHLSALFKQYQSRQVALSNQLGGTVVVVMKKVK